jgi:mannitol/fructose-specific phosphotransferase system IIA component (Ntr-type)
MPQAAQGSGYTFQSFLKKNQKRISTAIPHAKPTTVKKVAVIFLPERVVNFNSHFARKLTTL